MPTCQPDGFFIAPDAILFFKRRCNLFFPFRQNWVFPSKIRHDEIDLLFYLIIAKNAMSFGEQKIAPPDTIVRSDSIAWRTQ